MIEFAGIVSRRTAWRCNCLCGNTTTVNSGNLVSGKTQSCGCLMRERAALAASKTNRTHGLSKSIEYRIWNSMLGRCFNPNDRKYHRYGARGITVCERWRHSFPAFLADMGPRPSAEYSLDRIENDKDYEPGNCRWATSKTQNRNRGSYNNRIIAGGVERTASEWAEIAGVTSACISYRLKTGWTAEQAVGLSPGPPHGNSRFKCLV